MQFADAFDPIRALKSAWKMLSPSGLPLLTGGVILLLTGGGGGVGFPGKRSNGMHLEGVELLAVFACVGLVAIVFFLVSSWVSAGMATAVEKTIQNGSAEFGDVFDARGRFLDVILTRLLVFVITIGVLMPYGLLFLALGLASNGFDNLGSAAVGVAILVGLLYFVVVVYVSLGLSLSVLACVFEGLGPTASISRSWSLAQGNRLSLFVYWLVTGIFTLLGVLACCIGMFFTGSLSIIASYESYFALVRPEQHGNSWVVKGSPPPDGWNPGSPTPPFAPPPAPRMPPQMPPLAPPGTSPWSSAPASGAPRNTAQPGIPPSVPPSDERWGSAPPRPPSPPASGTGQPPTPPPLV